MTWPLKRSRIELRYVPRRSLRGMRFWLVRGWITDTPTAGPHIGLRVCGLQISAYPWINSRRRRAKDQS